MQVLQNIPQTFYDSAEYSVEYIVRAEYSAECSKHNAVSTDTVLYTTGPHCHGTLQLLDGTSWRTDLPSLR